MATDTRGMHRISHTFVLNVRCFDVAARIFATANVPWPGSYTPVVVHYAISEEFSNSNAPIVN
jgi:hypothetical protein